MPSIGGYQRIMKQKSNGAQNESTILVANGVKMKGFQCYLFDQNYHRRMPTTSLRLSPTGNAILP